MNLRRKQFILLTVWLALFVLSMFGYFLLLSAPNHSGFDYLFESLLLIAGIFIGLGLFLAELMSIVLDIIRNKRKSYNKPIKKIPVWLAVIILLIVALLLFLLYFGVTFWFNS